MPTSATVTSLQHSEPSHVKSRRMNDSKKSLQQKYRDERKRITTPDGDWFHEEFKYVEGCSNGLVILLH